VFGDGDKTRSRFEIIPTLATDIFFAPWLLDLIFVLDKLSDESYLTYLLKNITCAYTSADRIRDK